MGSPTCGDGRLPSVGPRRSEMYVGMVDTCYMDYRSEVRTAPSTLVQMQVPPVQVVELMPGNAGMVEIMQHDSSNLSLTEFTVLGGSPKAEEVKTLQKRLMTEMQLSHALQSKLQWYEEERSRELKGLSVSLEALREKERELEQFVSENKTKARHEQLQEVKVNAKKKVEHLEKQLVELKSECSAKSGILQTRQDDMENLKSELSAKGEEAQELAKTLLERDKQVDELQQKVNNNKVDLVKNLESVQNEVKALQSRYEAFAVSVRAIVNEYSVLDDPVAQALMSSVVKLNKDHEELKKKFSSESAERKQLYNKVLELKGNIRVFCRCRPLSASEVAAGVTSVAEFDSNRENDLVVRCIVNSTPTRKFFKFDRVFSQEASQGEVFADTAPVVTSVLDGYNVCIFAYGQTGTGKTFTMEGVPSNRGVNYRTLEELFKVAEERRGQVSYEIKVSVLEIYNEQIRDLLAAPATFASSPKKLEIKQGQEGGHWVPGLMETKVTRPEAVWDVLQNGSKNRSVGATNANEHSSRSHCMLCVMVRGENFISGEVTRSKLWLVDLAGSERVGKSEAQGDRLKEAQAINKSLSALGDVIAALTTKSAHVPYRNSKLTHLLQDSLGGDAKTLMFVQISPNDYDVGETLCSLNFASRVRGVELGPARRQTDCGELSKFKQMATTSKQELKSKDEAIRRLDENLRALEAKFKAKDSQCQTLSDKIRSREMGLADLESQYSYEKKVVREARASQVAAEAKEAAANQEIANVKRLQEQTLAALRSTTAELKEAQEATASARAEAGAARSEAVAAQSAAQAARLEAQAARAEAQAARAEAEAVRRKAAAAVAAAQAEASASALVEADAAANAPTADMLRIRNESSLKAGVSNSGSLVDGTSELQVAPSAARKMEGLFVSLPHADGCVSSGWNKNASPRHAESTEANAGTTRAAVNLVSPGLASSRSSVSPRQSTNPNAITPTRARRGSSASVQSVGVSTTTKDMASISPSSTGGPPSPVKDTLTLPEAASDGLQHAGSWSSTSVGSSSLFGGGGLASSAEERTADGASVPSAYAADGCRSPRWNENLDPRNAESLEIAAGIRTARSQAALQPDSASSRPWSPAQRYNTNPNAVTPTKTRKGSSISGSSAAVSIPSKDAGLLSTSSSTGTSILTKEASVEGGHGGLHHHAGSWSATSIGSSTSGGSISTDDQRSLTPNSSDSGSVNGDGGGGGVLGINGVANGGYKGYNGLMRLGAAADRMPLSGMKQNRESVDRSSDEPKRRKPVEKMVDHGDTVPALSNGSVSSGGSSSITSASSRGNGGVTSMHATASSPSFPDQKQKSCGLAGVGRLSSGRSGSAAAVVVPPATQRSKTPIPRSGGGGGAAVGGDVVRVKNVTVLEWRERRWNN